MVQFSSGIPEFNANSVDPDQTPQNAVPDLSLHCLSMSLYRDLRRHTVSEE